MNKDVHSSTIITIFELFDIEECRDLEILVGEVSRDHWQWRHLINRSHASSYSSSVVTMAISGTPVTRIRNELPRKTLLQSPALF